MTGVIVTFTVIRVGGDSVEPYGVVIADVEGSMRSARVESDLERLVVGARVDLKPRAGGGLVASSPVA